MFQSEKRVFRMEEKKCPQITLKNQKDEQPSQKGLLPERRNANKHEVK